MFPAVDKSESFPQRELAIGAFWKERDIYQKTLAARADAPSFVFYEGPPTANGMPHPGHCLTRAIKDLFPRYKTMRGYRCERKAGWDTHGLPVEVEVCKQLGIHSKEEIESYGIEPFIQLCQKSVWRYMQEWERLTERIGFWVNLEEAYVTYHQSYVESVWWSLKTLFDRGLLYQGHKIVWWWAQGGTALSAGEVGQGYREVADPSVFVKFPIVSGKGPLRNAILLVWTTTPWTLPSNHFAAVHPELEYSIIREPGKPDRFVVATKLIESLEGKTKLSFDRERTKLKGRDLLDLEYEPPFENYRQHPEKTRANIASPVDGDTGWIYTNAFALNYYFDWSSYANVSDLPDGQRQEWLKRWHDEHRVRSTRWHVVPGKFVTTDAGTGVVHVAPAFGEDDFALLQRERQLFSDPSDGPPLLNCVAPDGKFTDEAPEFVRGRWVKDCDKDLTRDLKQRGLLFHQEQYRHDYPFCWRAEEDPLIQYPRESWFIRTTDFKDQMLANNAAINWLPEHIKDGRFGKFLETNVDWALSRERYWGTPLPIWVCEETGKMEAVASYEELLAKPQAAGFDVWEAAKAANPELPDDLRVHKPYIDAVTYDSPYAKGARMQRVSEVIDCWYDSGAMPFAQWGFRSEDASDARERFESQFPADFISEALDQTRGWFYSQVAISTLLFGQTSRKENPKSQIPNPKFPHPFRNCIVLGLMLGEDGQKMSKSKRNYRDPSEIFDLYGADALRWFFFAKQPPWTTIRYSEQAIKDSIPEFLLRLWNVYSFFTIYANIDEFDPKAEGAKDACGFADATTYRPIEDRSELDRWILSELHMTMDTVLERMDRYDNYTACQAITEFVDALSNWYVRRSRDRFWVKEKRSQDKLDAYWTLYECLLDTSKLIAPFVPFLAESLWHNLAVTLFGEQVPESVHLCNYPKPRPATIDRPLSRQMNLVREITSLGRQARSGAELKVRQPLAKVEVILADTTHRAWLESHAGLIAEELNVKGVEFTENAEQYIKYSIVPNFKRLGPKLGKNMPKVKKLLGELDGGQTLARLKSAGKVTLDLGDGEWIEQVTLDEQDIEVRLQAKDGWAAAQGRGVVVVLATELTDELLAEGWINDLVRVIQDQRKEIGCEFTDRIEIGLVTESTDLQRAVDCHMDHIMSETLADSVSFAAVAESTPTKIEVAGAATQLTVSVVE